MIKPPPKRVLTLEKPKPGMTLLGMSSSRLGDIVEAALVEQLGWTALVGSYAGRARQGAFDMELPDGRWAEVKAVTVFASEYKVKPTALDIQDKLAWAVRHGRQPATVMVVVTRKGKGHVYVRDALGCYRLGADGLNWTYVGKVKVF